MKRILGMALILALILVPSLVLAANDLTTIPMRIDTFGSDVSIDTGRIVVNTIVVTAYTSAKTVTFIDNATGVALVLECPAGYTISWPTDGRSKLFAKGLTFDDSASDLAAGDFIFIWADR